MSIFAGIVVLDGAAPLPPALRDALRSAVRRNGAREGAELSGTGFAVCTLELGILDGAGHYIDDDGCVSVLAGEPLLETPPSGSRQLDQRGLHNELKAGRATVLRSARGTFCAALVDPGAGRACLAVDKLALRPIYWTVQSGHLYFASALRILEALPSVQRTIDVQGVAETAAFGYPLGARTPYLGIHCMRPGEIVRFERSSTSIEEYWRWDRLPELNVSENELCERLSVAFSDAVRIRLHGRRSAVAFLSGGLDSRCVVAALRRLGVEVHSLNFGPPRSADLVLGRMAAKALGTRHYEHPTGPVHFFDRMRATHRAWLDQGPAGGVPEAAQLIWSGDGGSCGMGHIYLTEAMIAHMRAGRPSQAIDAYLAYNSMGLPRRLFAGEQGSRVPIMPKAGILEELARLSGFDPGRDLHLFLMLNGQRRMLARHFEDLDLHRLEFALPFFDGRFLETVLAAPIDAFLRHRLYNRWVARVAGEVNTVPWQVYPGHEPGPVPAPANLRRQWESWYSPAERRGLRKEKLVAISAVLRDPGFPAWLLDRRILQLALWLTKLRLHDYSYLFPIAQLFARYARGNKTLAAD